MPIATSRLLDTQNSAQDFSQESYDRPSSPLPSVDWQNIHCTAPIPLDDSALVLRADIVVITWTSAEWSALDHVMLTSHSPRFPDETEWRKQWYEYRDNKQNTVGPLFYYRLVGINNLRGQQQRVLLVKSQVHLAHPPWLNGLEDFTDLVINLSGAEKIISTGTAGGGSLADMLGGVTITNQAYIKLEKPENKDCRYNHQTFNCSDWFPAQKWLPAVRETLLFPMNKIWNTDTISSALAELNQDKYHYNYADLINTQLQPESLESVQVQLAKDRSLLTTDYYFIEGEEPKDPFCFLEMDDAVIAHQATKCELKFAFIRNISDPIVPTHTASGAMIPNDIRGNWSGLIYKYCGFYSSFNSAMITWAVIASEK